MTVNIGDEVKYSDKPYFEGHVRSVFKLSNNGLYCVVEAADHRVFVCREIDLNVINSKMQTCKHDMGFTYHQGPNGSYWICRVGCGFGLNFNPANLMRILKDTPRSTDDKKSPAVYSENTYKSNLK